eukprot:jgi/Chlat1/2690/Chrsp180S02866
MTSHTSSVTSEAESRFERAAPDGAIEQSEESLSRAMSGGLTDGFRDLRRLLKPAKGQQAAADTDYLRERIEALERAYMDGKVAQERVIQQMIISQRDRDLATRTVMDAAAKQLESHKAAARELKRSLAKRDDEFVAKLKELDDSKSQVFTLQQEVEAKEASLHQLATKDLSMRNLMDAAAKQLESHKAAAADMKSTLAKRDEELVATRAAMESAAKELESHQATAAELQEVLAKRDEEFAAMLKELDDTKSRVQKLQHEMEAKEASLQQQLAEQDMAKCNAVDAAAKQLRSHKMAAAEFRKVLVQRDEELAAKVNELDNAQYQVRKLQQEMEAKEASLQQLAEQHLASRTAMDTAAKQLESQSAAAAELKQTLVKRDEEVAAKLKELDDSKSQAHALQKDLPVLQALSNDQKLRSEQLTQQLQAKDVALQAAVQRQQACEAALLDAEKLQEKHAALHMALEQHNHALSNKLTAKVKEHDNTKSQLRKLQQEMEAKAASLQHLAEKELATRTCMDAATKQLDRHDAVAAEMTLSLAKRDEELADKVKELDNTKSQVLTLQQGMVAKEASLQQLAEQVQALQQDLRAMQALSNDQQLRSEQLTQQLQAKDIALQAALERQQACEAALVDAEELQEKHAALQLAAEQHTHALGNKLTVKLKELDDTKSRVQTLQHEMEAKEASLEKLAEKDLEARTVMDSAVKQLESNKATMAELKGCLAKRDDELAATRAVMDASAKELESHRAAAAELRKSLAKQDDELAAKLEELNNTKSQVQQLQQEMVAQEEAKLKELEDTKSQVLELQQEVEGKEVSLQQLAEQDLPVLQALSNDQKLRSEQLTQQVLQAKDAALQAAIECQQAFEAALADAEKLREEHTALQVALEQQTRMLGNKAVIAEQVCDQEYALQDATDAQRRFEATLAEAQKQLTEQMRAKEEAVKAAEEQQKSYQSALSAAQTLAEQLAEKDVALQEALQQQSLHEAALQEARLALEEVKQRVGTVNIVPAQSDSGNPNASIDSGPRSSFFLDGTTISDNLCSCTKCQCHAFSSTTHPRQRMSRLTGCYCWAKSHLASSYLRSCCRFSSCVPNHQFCSVKWIRGSWTVGPPSVYSVLCQLCAYVRCVFGLVCTWLLILTGGSVVLLYRCIHKLL